MKTTKDRFSEINFSTLYSDNEPIDSLASTFIYYISQTRDVISYRIPKNKSYRIDLICKEHYENRIGLFWILYYINAISCIEDLAEGSILLIPSLSAIEAEYTRAKDKVKSSPDLLL